VLAYAALAILGSTFIIVASLWWLQPAVLGPRSVGGPPPIVIVAAAGTIWNVSAGDYKDVGPIDLSSDTSWRLDGSFTSSNGIAAYILTSSDIALWNRSPAPPAEYSWSSGGSVTSGTLDNVILPSDTYYIVWDNTNPSVPTSIEITSMVYAG